MKYIIALLALLFGQHGTVTGQVFEGYERTNDVYIVTLESGQDVDVYADDLNDGDHVTVFFLFNEPVRTLYGWR